MSRFFFHKPTSDYLQVEETNALLSAARQLAETAKGPKRRLAAKRDVVVCELLLYTGLKVSELLELRRSDIDHTQRTITVRSRRGKYAGIPIPGLLLPTLNSWFQHLGKAKSVFPSPLNEKLSQRTFQSRLATLAARAGVRKITPNTLRHTFALGLRKAGADFKTIQALLGHSRVETTMALYWHPAATPDPTPDHLRKASDNAAGLLRGDGQPLVHAETLESEEPLPNSRQSVRADKKVPGETRGRGAPKNQITQYIYAECYKRMKEALAKAGSGKLLDGIRLELKRDFTDSKYITALPKKSRHVSEFARRWALSQSPPLPWPLTSPHSRND